MYQQRRQGEGDHWGLDRDAVLVMGNDTKQMLQLAELRQSCHAGDDVEIILSLLYIFRRIPLFSSLDKVMG
jgi:hypothetical protein